MVPSGPQNVATKVLHRNVIRLHGRRKVIHFQKRIVFSYLKFLIKLYQMFTPVFVVLQLAGRKLKPVHLIVAHIYAG